MQGLAFRERTSWRSLQQAAFFFVFLPLFPFFVKVVAELPLSDVGHESAPDLAAVRALANQPGAVPAAESTTEFRTELLMGLDLFVRAERVLRAESSTFTRSLGRVPEVLGGLTHFYRIDIARATRNQLLVIATGEGRRSGSGPAPLIVGDRIAVDENFRVNSNFPLPAPPRDYLHTMARTVMNHIYASGDRVPEGREVDLWEGVFRGYFKYESRPMSSGGKTIVARGVRVPVLGDVVEMQPEADLYRWVFEHRNGVWAEHELYGHLEDIYLAQKIHQDHTGAFSPGLKALLPTWAALFGLTGEQSPITVQDFQLDQTFGFHAEVAQRGLASAPASRAWSVNGYGQVSEVATIESIVDTFEQARKKVATSGEVTATLPIVEQNEPTVKLPLSGSLGDGTAALRDMAATKTPEPPVSSEQGRKPLVIDALESDK